MSQINPLTRRAALQRLGDGFGGLALATMLSEAAASSRQTARTPNSLPKAKAVIQLYMHGGPSHVDLLDPKPMLNKFHDTPPPGEVADDEKRTKNLMGSPFQFKKCGSSGLEFSEIQPWVSQHADEIAVVRSMFTEHRNHEQAIWMAQTGLTVAGRPTLGSWVTYGLGSENQNLPGFVALPDPKGQSVDGVRNWSSGWLPPQFQGTVFREQGSPVLHLEPSKPRTQALTNGRLRLLKQLNQMHLAERAGALELEARIDTFEMAGRMQLAATDALDLSQETQETQKLYGIDNPTTKSYGTRCLMARRLVERGVRFVSLFMAGQPWDTHSKNNTQTKACCDRTDLPIGGLLTDLKRRGLLDSTLILWGGEFGRTPGAQQSNKQIEFGRDHHPYGFSVWMAGGGIKGGQAYGATDDFGYRAIEKRTQTANLHATILHLLGLDHEILTYPHNGRDERLTDLYDAKILKELIA
ncbi:DUF1501 domain-containing protein [Gimesia panareensis]|uniref:DUF1501 domain-containing protein n=1 Tax=Gimesia panareensis TaxID=2527978 RepID=UPI00118B908D|nr:DUF1501 domain-containing protein [Gimesia panareensis]QDU49032.1 hypothetical protein Pan110_13490 [Gimesia panareensis]